MFRKLLKHVWVWVCKHRMLFLLLDALKSNGWRALSLFLRKTLNCLNFFDSLLLLDHSNSYSPNDPKFQIKVIHFYSCRDFRGQKLWNSRRLGCWLESCCYTGKYLSLYKQQIGARCSYLKNLPDYCSDFKLDPNLSYFGILQICVDCKGYFLFMIQCINLCVKGTNE